MKNASRAGEDLPPGAGMAPAVDLPAVLAMDSPSWILHPALGVVVLPPVPGGYTAGL